MAWYDASRSYWSAQRALFDCVFANDRHEPQRPNLRFFNLSKHAKVHNISTPIITFHQPLWWKAYSIINRVPPESDLRMILVR